jgi:glycosyl transferase family 25
MEAEFDAFNLDGVRLDAVRWSALSAQAQNHLYSESLNRQQFHVPLVAGEKGCYASHHKAWDWLVASGLPAMVVLEDDVQLTPQLLKVISSLESINVGWDMIKLIGRESEKIRARRPFVEGVDLIDYKRIPSLTAGYIISREGAIKLSQKRRPFGRPIDVDLRYWWECDMRILGVSPACLILDETSLTSSIGQKGLQRNWCVQWKKFRNKIRMTCLNMFHSIRRGTMLKD